MALTGPWKMLIRVEREPSDLALQVRNPRSRKKQHPVQGRTARHSKAKCLFSALKHSWDFFFLTSNLWAGKV